MSNADIPEKGSGRMMASREDEIVVRNFLQGYSVYLGLTVTKLIIPDKGEREKKAVDALVTWKSGQTTAIEHTLIQPFSDEQYKLRGEIGQVFEPLCDDKDVALTEHHIWLKVPLDGLPKNADRHEAAKVVREWLMAARDRLPEGWSEGKITGLSFDLTVGIFKQFLGQGSEGTVSVSYFGERVKGELCRIVRKALCGKLDKLMCCDAQERLLLFEMRVRGDIANCLDLAQEDFPQLRQVDAVWLADTSEKNRQHRIICQTIWSRLDGPRYFNAAWDDNPRWPN